MMSPENRFTPFAIMPYLFVFTQFRTENRYTLFLEFALTGPIDRPAKPGGFSLP
ncbi:MULTISPECIES: hypothetical protein [unclassified Mesorhizobium]|uniref:hypothetical protein n=1 Tax=unclassified Mesorhizobium TaxID=325217 RepID=UPI0015E2E777|nr:MULTISPECIES: hypothetical protein [unclassified Mesorhizobium]